MTSRLIDAALSLVALVTLTFGLAHAMPGGPGYAIMSLKAKPIAADAVDLQLGAGTPLWLQYVTWWWHLLHGSLGNSYLLNRPVAGLLVEYGGHSLALQTAGVSLGVLLSLAGGLAHGAFYRSWPGRLVGALELVLYATPGFVIGTFMILAFAGVLPPGGISDLHQAAPSLADRLRHLVLPVLSIGLMTYAGLARFLAEGLDAELAKPYARTAAAKGLGPAAILLRHAAPNGLRPVVTLLGLSLPALFAGSVVIEGLFAYPGLGWLMWRSALSHDYPVLSGGVLLIGTATIAGNLAADWARMMLDPPARLA